MPAPSNISFATAAALGTLPAAAEQRVDDGAGTTSDVFFSVTVVDPQRELFAFAFGGAEDSGYQPRLRVYDAGQTLLFSGAINKPMQFPVSPGLYYLKAEKNGDFDPSNLTLQVLAHQHQPVTQDGAIIIPDDTGGFPATILSRTVDNVVLDFVADFPAGEQGDILNEQQVILQQDEDGSEVELLSIDRDRTLTSIATIPFSGTPIIRANREAGNFYLGENSSPSAFQTVAPDGTLGTLHIMTGITSLASLAASADETVLVFSRNIASAPLQRWDIINDVPLSDLAAAETDYRIGDILEMDGSFVAMYFSSAANGRIKVKRYSASGQLQNVYDFGLSTDYLTPAGAVPRLGYDIVPGQFVVYLHPASEPGVAHVVFLRAEDGVEVDRRRFMEYEEGKYNADQTDTPSARFGSSASCPIYIWLPPPEDIVIVDESIPCCDANAVGEPCDCTGGSTSSGSVSTGSSSSQPPSTSTGPILPPEIPIGPVNLLSDAYWDQACEGGGLVPTAADPVDAEDWAEAVV